MPADNPIKGLSPVWLGVGIAGSLLLVLIGTETILGRWGQLRVDGEFDALANVSSGILRDFRIAVVHCLVIGYLPAAFLHVMRSGRQTVLALRKALDCSRGECQALAAAVKLNTRWIVLIGLLGLVMALASPYLVQPVPPTPWKPSTWSLEVAWHRVLGPATMIWTGWLIYAIAAVSAQVTRNAEKLKHIDLLDQSSLAPFAQLGLTNALLPIGLLSIWSLMMIEEGFGTLTWIISGSVVLTSVLALVYPVRGVHKRLAEAKENEIRWISGEIAKRRDALRNKEAAGRSGELTDLIAYRGLVDSVPEWPFTTSNYTRLLLYALLPVASWCIGVIAEEIIGRALF